MFWPACDAEFSVVKIGQTSDGKDGNCFGNQIKFIMKNMVSYPLSLSNNILFAWQNFLGVKPTFEAVNFGLNSWTSEVFD